MKNSPKFPSRSSWLISVLAIVFGFSVSSSAVYAQESSPSAGVLEEIIVTAQKRAQRLIDVPVSISAYSAEDLDERGVRNFEDVVALTPGITFRSNGGETTNLSIRGISSSVGADTTAIYIDDMPVRSRGGLTNGNAFLPRVFDLERIEILRGPQGTLFGAGAMAGVVRFITPEPSLTDFSGYSRAEIADTLGGDLSNEFGIAFGGPIIQDKLGFRASGWYRKDGGYIDHHSILPGGADERNSNSSDTYAAKLSTKFVPTDNTSITASLYAQDLNQHDLSLWRRPVSDPSNNKYITDEPLLMPMRSKFLIPSLQVDVDLAGLTLTSLTTMLRGSSLVVSDYTFFISEIYALNPPRTEHYSKAIRSSEQRNFSQEFRLSSAEDARLAWTLGAYYGRSKYDGDQSVEQPGFVNLVEETYGVPFEEVYPDPLVDGLYMAVAKDNFITDEQLAAFLDINYEIWNEVYLTAGLRAARQDFEFLFTGTGPVYGHILNEGEQSESPLTPRIGLEYRPNPNSNIYLMASKGYRLGGSNSFIPIATDACQDQLAAIGGIKDQYTSDTLWNYEIGTKSSLLNDRLRIYASAFMIDWKDIQQSIAVPACGYNFIDNVGVAVSKGFDVEMRFHPFDDLSADIAIGYTSAKYDEALLTTEGNVFHEKGDQISDARPWSIASAVQYDTTLFSDVAAYIRVAHQYNAKNKEKFPQSTIGGARYDPYFRTADALNELNLRVGIRKDRMELTAFVNNALNSHARLRQISGNSHGAQRTYSMRPRTVGLTLIYRY